jgi:3-hydroxyisobutyrate dehydrogenase-like beta-hydroxyacid dehydrogenase
MDIGFIGLGQMGAGMAANLIKTGHRVTVYNRTADKMRALVALGANPASTVAEACRGGVVITMVSDDQALESITFGAAGIVANLPEQALHISSSSVGVALAETLAGAHEAARQSFVSAPVFGRPSAAADGTLAIAVAGPASGVEIALPLLKAMGDKTFVVGEKASAANVVKLSGHFLIASVIEALGEAVALIEKGGADRHAYINLLTSSLFNVPIYKNYGQRIADRNYQSGGVTALQFAAGIRLTLAAAEELHVPMPIARLVQDRLVALQDRGDAALDCSAIASLAAMDAGE